MQRQVVLIHFRPALRQEIHIFDYIIILGPYKSRMMMTAVFEARLIGLVEFQELPPVLRILLAAVHGIMLSPVIILERHTLKRWEPSGSM